MASLSARSVVASTLLGTLPPRLPGRLLVAFAEEFGINPGTTRVALSRMVDKGELARDDDGVYELRGPLLDRQARQEAGLAPRTRPWDGGWELYVVRAGARDSADRSALRQAADHLGLAELRDGVWLRPDNLDPDRLPGARAVVDGQADRFTGAPAAAERAGGLAASLFAVADWSEQAEELIAAMEALTDDDATPLAAGFELAARTLRHLVADPLLPPELWPDRWPAPRLRDTYADYDRAFRSRLSAFFRAQTARSA